MKTQPSLGLSLEIGRVFSGNGTMSVVMVSTRIRLMSYWSTYAQNQQIVVAQPQLLKELIKIWNQLWWSVNKWIILEFWFLCIYPLTPTFWGSSKWRSRKMGKWGSKISLEHDFFLKVSWTAIVQYRVVANLIEFWEREVETLRWSVR